MISREHNKHAGLKKPSFGDFGRNEWSITGAPCAVIRDLATTIAAGVSVRYKCAYVDGDHAMETELSAQAENHFAIEYTDKISHQQFDFTGNWSAFKYRHLFRAFDLILVNGNHHTAKSQVII